MLLAPRRLSKFSSQQSNLPLSLELCFWKHFLFLSSAQSVGGVYIGNRKRNMKCSLLATFAFFLFVFLVLVFLLLCEDIEKQKEKNGMQVACCFCTPRICDMVWHQYGIFCFVNPISPKSKQQRTLIANSYKNRVADLLKLLLGSCQTKEEQVVAWIRKA